MAAEWNVMRMWLDDAFTLGLASQAEAGASIGQNVFARFEGANGEYGAHEFLEATSEESCEGFKKEGLSAGDTEAAPKDRENNKGVLYQSSQAYVHTFETTGTHEYSYVPHEAAGMVGSVTVE